MILSASLSASLSATGLLTEADDNNPYGTLRPI